MQTFPQFWESRFHFCMMFRFLGIDFLLFKIICGTELLVAVAWTLLRNYTLRLIMIIRFRRLRVRLLKHIVCIALLLFLRVTHFLRPEIIQIRRVVWFSWLWRIFKRVILWHAISQLLISQSGLRLVEARIHNYQAFYLVFKRFVWIFLQFLQWRFSFVLGFDLINDIGHRGGLI